MTCSCMYTTCMISPLNVCGTSWCCGWAEAMFGKEWHAYQRKQALWVCGTRFVPHKVAALGCLIDCYGAYLAHLTSLIEDPKVNSVDKEKLRDYVRKRRDSKLLLGCALFHDNYSQALCGSMQSARGGWSLCGWSNWISPENKKKSWQASKPLPLNTSLR